MPTLPKNHKEFFIYMAKKQAEDTEGYTTQYYLQQLINLLESAIVILTSTNVRLRPGTLTHYHLVRQRAQYAEVQRFALYRLRGGFPIAELSDD